jgi:hypothetical protein
MENNPMPISQDRMISVINAANRAQQNTKTITMLVMETMPAALSDLNSALDKINDPTARNLIEQGLAPTLALLNQILSIAQARLIAAPNDEIIILREIEHFNRRAKSNERVAISQRLAREAKRAEGESGTIVTRQQNKGEIKGWESESANYGANVLTYAQLELRARQLLEREATKANTSSPPPSPQGESGILAQTQAQNNSDVDLTTEPAIHSAPANIVVPSDIDLL